MVEYRQYEINDLAKESYTKLTDAQTKRAEIEFALAEKLNKALEEDKKVKQLRDEINKEVLYKKICLLLFHCNGGRSCDL